MSIAKGEVKVDVNLIVDLEQKNQTQNQTIGEQRKSIQVLEQQLKDKEQTHAKELVELTERLGKQVIFGEIKSKSAKCPNCGWWNSPNWSTCQSCGFQPSTTQTVYKNLDDVVEDIRKAEAKKIKANVLELEEKTDSLEFEKARLEKTVKKLEKQKEIEITEAKSRLRERLNGIIEEKDKEITELHEEMLKIQEDKTDIQIEEARKQEIIDLRVHLAKLEEDKEALIKLLPIWKQRQFNNRKAKLEALIQITEKEDQIEEISNNYPRVTRVRRWGKTFENFLKTKRNSWVEKAKTSSRYEVDVNSISDFFGY
ncbi:MAG TPA: hypothetical protein VMV86_06635 [Methanosarcinales archaeon]|nr:hypothetical protein [Methanosarcinales archaeon]